MLSTQHRLTRSADFARVYKQGKTLKTAFFRISTAENGLPHSRFGVVVPNKLIKRAVKRNIKKRQIRAALQPLLRGVRGGYDIVVTPQGEAVDVDQATLAADIRAGLTKIGFYRNT